jgi:hypothetical protein
MANHTYNPYDHIPKGEKISLIDKVLETPGCPIPRDFSLTHEQKLDLFAQLIEAGAIKYTPCHPRAEEKKSTPQQPSAPEQTESAQIHQDHISQSRPTPYSIIGVELHKEDVQVAISQKARFQGLYIIGANGTGKSTLLANLILTDIKQGLGVCLIEPHGDLTKTVLAGIPKHRLDDVILLDMTDSEYPFGLNLFQCDEPRTINKMAVVSNLVYHVFQKIWHLDAATSPRLLQVLRALTLTLIENPGSALSEAPLLLSSDTVRATMVENLTNQEIISFWEGYNRRSQRDKDDLTASTGNKISAFLDDPMTRHIVSQSKTTIDLRKVMDSGSILLVKLSPQFEEASMLIGAILIGKLLMTAFSRTDTPEENRRQFNLYCDEFQRFATPDFATLISEARKFRIATCLSHQTLSQLDEANRAAAAAAGNLIVSIAPRPSGCATGHPSPPRTLGLAATDSFRRDRLRSLTLLR